MVPVLSNKSVEQSPAASTARPDIAKTLRCTRRSIPAMPIADKRPPIVVGADDEHDRVADHMPRVELYERFTNGTAQNSRVEDRCPRASADFGRSGLGRRHNGNGAAGGTWFIVHVGGPGSSSLAVSRGPSSTEPAAIWPQARTNRGRREEEHQDNGQENHVTQARSSVSGRHRVASPRSLGGTALPAKARATFAGALPITRSPRGVKAY